jgi:F-type H+-transporting ATPase subunit a
VSRKIFSYILGALFFFLIVAARPQQHQTENSAQDPRDHIEQQHAENQNSDVPHEDDQHKDDQHGVEFNPGEFIFDHIGDAHEWHILTYKDFHLSIPLPVIVYSKSKGLNVFMFSKFHHGHKDYKGFRFEMHGENEGKIVEINDDGSTQSPFLNLSFTKNAFAILISCLLLLWLFISVARAYKKRPNKAPTGMQNLVEPIILFIRDDIAIPSIGEKKAERFLPFLLSIFFFIWINNMMGLIPIFPGGANVTGNITVTMLLALFTFSITTINGNKDYWIHIFNPPGVPWWLKFPVPLMPIIEIVGMFTKPFVLMVRLFANISAGHIIALGFFSLIFIFGQMQLAMGYVVSPLTLAFTIFMTFLELLVALIQAYVFTLLSALYFGMATTEHH